MSDAIFDQLSKATQDLEKKFHGGLFRESTSVGKVRSKCTTLSQFKDNIEVVDSLVDVIESDDVGTLELFVDLNFRIEGIFVILVFKNFVFVDNFDCDLSLCFFLDPQIDF
mgnify:CR=1 FL=1